MRSKPHAAQLPKEAFICAALRSAGGSNLYALFPSLKRRQVPQIPDRKETDSGNGCDADQFRCRYGKSHPEAEQVVDQ